MPASTSVATVIRPYQLVQGGVSVAPEKRLGEKNAQTFLQGTPLQLSGGFLQACAAIVSAATALIAGFSVEAGSNLTTSAVAKTLTTGQGVPNQASAVIIPIGAPANDGTVGIAVATDGVSFIGTMGHSTDNTLAVLAAADVGSVFGLTKDAGNNMWYVDKAITTVAAGACVEVTGLVDAITTLNGKVIFRVMKAAQQLMF